MKIKLYKQYLFLEFWISLAEIYIKSIYNVQVSKTAKVHVEDLSQQLDAADKQLRSTRQFLEEQAQEREAEREDWERKLAALQAESRRYSSEFRRSTVGSAIGPLDRMSTSPVVP